MKGMNFLLVGVGGQGTILASNILAETGLGLGFDVKKAEVHGMSQRGGSVISHIRWAEKVFSPILSEGEADYLAAFEKIEAVRFINYLRPKANVLINDYRIVPLSVRTSKQQYLSDDEIQTALKHRAENIFWVNGMKIAESLGNIKTTNVVILGALSALLQYEVEKWLEAIEKYVPLKARKLNINAFHLGREEMFSNHNK